MQGVATGICWGLVIATWIVGGLYGLRRAPPQKRSAEVGGGLWRIGVIIFLGLVYLAGRHELHQLVVRSPWVEIPGLVLLVASTVFTLWARLSLGMMWSISPGVLQDHHELRTDGPYAVTRHPIYTGLLGMLLGTVLLNGLGVLLVSLVAGVVVFATRVPVEEKLMSETFPGDYEQYRRRVPQLIPGLYRVFGRPR